MEVVIEEDEISQLASVQRTSLVVHVDDLSGTEGSSLNGLRDGAASELDEVSDAVVNGDDGTSEGVLVLSKDSLVVGEDDVLLAELVVTLGETHSGHGIGDEDGASGVGLVGETDRVRVGVDAINNDAVVGSLVFGHAEDTNHTGVSVVEGVHGVEEVGEESGTVVDADLSLLDGGDGVTLRDGHTLGDHELNGLGSTGVLGGNGDDLDVVEGAVHVHDALGALHRGLDAVKRMSTSSLRSNEGTLTVATEGGATLLDGTGTGGVEGEDLLVDLRGGGDDGGADGDATGAGELLGDVVDLLDGDLGVGEVEAVGTIDLDINEAGGDEAIVTIDDFVSDALSLAVGVVAVLLLGV